MPLKLKRRDGSVTLFRNAEYIPFYYLIPKSYPVTRKRYSTIVRRVSLSLLCRLWKQVVVSYIPKAITA